MSSGNKGQAVLSGPQRGDVGGDDDADDVVVVAGVDSFFRLLDFLCSGKRIIQILYHPFNGSNIGLIFQK